MNAINIDPCQQVDDDFTKSKGQGKEILLNTVFIQIGFLMNPEL